MKLVKKSVIGNIGVSIASNQIIETCKVIVGITALGFALLNERKSEVYGILDNDYIQGSPLQSDINELTLEDIVIDECKDLLDEFNSTDKYYVADRVILDTIEKCINNDNEDLGDINIFAEAENTVEEQLKILAEDISKNPADYGYDNSIYTDGITGYLGDFVITGYCGCSSCCGKSNGITADGSYATANHTIAADSRFAFGTELLIDGITYEVEDRGGAIKGNRIDRFFDNHSDALSFGKRTASVYSIDSSSNKTLALRYSK